MVYTGLGLCTTVYTFDNVILLYFILMIKIIILLLLYYARLLIYSIIVARDGCRVMNIKNV